MQSFFDYIKKEWAALIAAPWSFAGLTAVCLGAGFAAGMLYYSSQVGSLREQLNAKDGQLGRYRVALGMDPASKGALVELNNQELALKAQWLVLHLRQFRVELEEKCKAIDQQANSGAINKKDAEEAKWAAISDVSQAFDSNLASDTYNVENELRKRLDANALSHVVRVPVYNAANGNGGISMAALMRGSPFDAFMITVLADEIDQMSKLLPPDS